MLDILTGARCVPKPSSKCIIQQKSSARNPKPWDFTGWGDVFEATIGDESLQECPRKKFLGVNEATAISGNDLLASVLYTTGIVTSFCGQLAPICMLMACLSLLPYKWIFKELGTAIPRNGGLYVSFLNSSSKLTATFAASCSLICYSATAVVSAASWSSYASSEFGGSFPQIPITICVLMVVALLVLSGVQESANVALAIFCFHLVTIGILTVTSVVFICQSNGSILKSNYESHLPVSSSGGIGMDIWLGYSAALLGLTGFETSANFIEDLGPFESESSKKGPQRRISTFERTIDRMWMLVIVINPIISLSTLGVLTLPEIADSSTHVLSTVGYKSAGNWLRIMVTVDALAVLGGGVLTAFVGVSGIIKQLASDRCFPAFLLIQNKCANTYHWIVIGFCCVCVVMYLITAGSLQMLTSLFTGAFLLVLLSFAAANMALKYSRPELPRGTEASWPTVFLGFTLMLIGLIGNVVIDVGTVYNFLIFLALYLGVITASFERIRITKLILYFVERASRINTGYVKYLRNKILQFKKHRALYFAKTSELHILNKVLAAALVLSSHCQKDIGVCATTAKQAIVYARDNENCERLIICHVLDFESYETEV
jgi:amino acid transporter